MKGYWNRPEETAAVLSSGGWLATGDRGVMQADGRVRLIDRIKDMILVSGFNVYPNEIEDVVAAHPLVEEVAAIGVADPVQGERVRIIVVSRSKELTSAMLIDRIKDMILVSGFNVYPNEIEDVVAAHPLVEEVAAIGVPDPVQGERVRIIVVSRSPELTSAMLIEHCRDQLTGYKVPREVVFRAEPLPKSPVGKVLRRALRDAE